MAENETHGHMHPFFLKASLVMVVNPEMSDQESTLLMHNKGISQKNINNKKKKKKMENGFISSFWWMVPRGMDG